jgi:intein/homing endonuclease
MKSNVSAWFNKKNKSTECLLNEKSLNSTAITSNLIPMEYYMSKEMNGKPRFIQFFPDDSNIIGPKAIYLAYNYYDNAKNLNQWIKQAEETEKKKEIEKTLKIFFKQIHEGLLMMKKKGRRMSKCGQINASGI